MFGFAILGRDLIMIECVKIKIGHQLCLYIVNRLCKSFDEFVEVFFVKENFVPVIAIIVKTLTAFCDGQVIVIASCSSYIKKIRSSFSSANPFAVDTFHFLVVVLVRHSFNFFLQLKNALIF